ncbi:hypothetical protein ACFE04_014447 [Oxalis oulophora]
MESNKKVTSSSSSSSSSSSFTSDLFGSKQATQSVSTGIFASIFPPPESVSRRHSSSSEEFGSSWPNRHSGNQEWNGKSGASAQYSEEVVNYDIPIKDKNSPYQEDRENPWSLSSSIHYGGRDDYSNSKNCKNSGSYTTTFKKDGGEDDASRGNWWQGSLYY